MMRYVHVQAVYLAARVLSCMLWTNIQYFEISEYQVGLTWWIHTQQTQHIAAPVLRLAADRGRLGSTALQSIRAFQQIDCRE